MKNHGFPFRPLADTTPDEAAGQAAMKRGWPNLMALRSGKGVSEAREKSGAGVIKEYRLYTLYIYTHTPN